MSPDMYAKIQAELEQLDLAAQDQVLDFVRRLNRHKKGTSGAVVASFAGLISTEELKRMDEAIQSGCGQGAGPSFGLEWNRGERRIAKN